MTNGESRGDPNRPTPDLSEAEKGGPLAVSELGEYENLKEGHEGKLVVMLKDRSEESPATKPEMKGKVSTVIGILALIRGVL